VSQRTSGDPVWTYARNQMNGLRISAARQMIRATADTCYSDIALCEILQGSDGCMQMWCRHNTRLRGVSGAQHTNGGVRLQIQNIRINGFITTSFIAGDVLSMKRWALEKAIFDSYSSRNFFSATFIKSVSSIGFIFLYECIVRAGIAKSV
jgi:hypothetical protein